MSLSLSNNFYSKRIRTVFLAGTSLGLIAGLPVVMTLTAAYAQAGSGYGGDSTGAGGAPSETGAGNNGVDGGGGGAGENGGNGGGSNGGAGATVAGGNGVNGGDSGGGGGGGHGYVGPALPTQAVTGGSGGSGGDGPGNGDGGGGGGGGFGAVITNNINNMTLDAKVQGGNGGGGGYGSYFSGGNGNGSGGDGGGGGHGLVFQEQATDVVVSDGVHVTGGDGGGGGGEGGNTGSVGDGGSGGYAIVFENGGSLNIASGAKITGGNGGGSDTTGSRSGGNGGDGIRGANLSIVTAGTISGGQGGNGGTAGTAGKAITFTSGTNSLELRSGYSFTGDVVADDTANSDDTLILGGTENSTFDLSKLGNDKQFQGFENFNKTGTSTWTATGTSAFSGTTTISAGTLQLGNGGTSGTLGSGDVSVEDGASLAFKRSDAMTIANAISGAGAINQIGSGTTTLTTDNSGFTGTTTISAGTLQLGNGGTSGTLGSGDVSVKDDASLAFKRSDAMTITNAISGAGAINQIGSGTTTLTTDNSGFTGTTTIKTGRLQINNTLGGTIAVNSGGTLGGTGTVGELTVKSGGTLAPGNSIGTMNANGPVTFDKNSTYEVELKKDGFDAGTHNDLLDAGGNTVTISGGTIKVKAVDDGEGYTAGTYTIIQTTGTINKAFDSVEEEFAYLNFTNKLNDNSEKLLLVSSLSATTFALDGMTPNQTAIGDAAFALGSGHAVYTAMLNQSDANAGNALNQLSGEGFASQQTALMDSGFRRSNRVLDRISNAFKQITPTIAPLGYAAIDASIDDDQPTQQKEFWFTPYGTYTDYKGNGNAAGFTRAEGGLELGADTLVGDWLVGGFIGLGVSDSSISARGTDIDSTDFSIGAYAGTQINDIGFSFGAAYTRSWLDSNRNVSVGGLNQTLKADYGVNQFTAFGEINKSFDLGGTELTPYGRLNVTHQSTDKFTETGGSAALTVAVKDQTSAVTEIGVRAAHEMTFGATPATLSGGIGWQHRFGDAPQTVNSFSNGQGFTVTGAPGADDSLTLSAGIGFNLSNGANLDLNYKGALALDGNGTSHAVMSRFSRSF